MRRPLIINFKNYLEVASEKTIELAKAAEKVSNNMKVEVVLAPPQPSIAAILQNIQLPVICQHVDDELAGSTTGFFIPEIAKSYGAMGSLINHSEHTIDHQTVGRLVKRLRNLHMISIVCARTSEEVTEIAKFAPDFIAIEPPELIGSGKAVSKESPSIITNSIKAVSSYSSSTKVICGAGIVNKSDVTSAVQLGAEGILVATGIIKARSWIEKISELALGLNAHI